MKILSTTLSTVLIFSINAFAQNGLLVFQSDFGLKDGAVSAMKGVAMGVSPTIKIFDITHEIPPYDIWEASFRLIQTAPYWPEGTVFVSVCDPGVGTQRKSVVVLTRSGHYFVTPDNGTLTHIAEALGIQEVHEINEALNRRQNSNDSYTFHGRDVYAYTGAMLASKKVTLAQIGKLLPPEIVKISYTKAHFSGDSIVGSIPVLDIQFGNIWTDIDKKMFEMLGLKPGENLDITIRNEQTVSFGGKVPFVNTFGEVGVGENMGYLNSLLNFSLATNQENFSEKYGIGSGPNWQIILRKSKK